MDLHSCDCGRVNVEIGGAAVANVRLCVLAATSLLHWLGNQLSLEFVMCKAGAQDTASPKGPPLSPTEKQPRNDKYSIVKRQVQM